MVKEQRLTIRLTTKEKEEIRSASFRSGQSITNYVLNSLKQDLKQ